MEKQTEHNKIPKKQPFEAPQGYFYYLPSKVMARVQESAKPQPSIWRSYAPRLTYAFTALVLLLALVYTGLNTNNKKMPDSELLVAQISEEAAYSYLSYQSLSMHEIYTEDIAAYTLLNDMNDEALPEEDILNELDGFTNEELW